MLAALKIVDACGEFLRSWFITVCCHALFLVGKLTWDGIKIGAASSFVLLKLLATSVRSSSSSSLRQL